MVKRLKLINSYFFSIILLASLFLGCLVGYFLGEKSYLLKPLGDIFIRLIFIAIVPLIFFSVSSSVSRIGSLEKLGKIMICMMAVFIMTGTIAGLLTMMLVKFFPPVTNLYWHLTSSQSMSPDFLSLQFRT